jgi:hypothetical protein
MKNILVNKVKTTIKNTLPVNAYFIEGVKKIISNEQPKLKFAKSKFYNTQMMACYTLYKPTFLKNTYDK